MYRFSTKLMLLVGLGAFALMPNAKADPWNQKTIFTFSDSVEIPGQVLPAGTYVFKLANTHHRNVIQVFNKEESRVLSTFLAIPDYRLHPSDKTIITFDERAAGSPRAVKGWFYPGRNHGHEFVYPKNAALELAKANNTPVPAMPTELSADTARSDATLNGPEVAAMTAAPLKAEDQTGREVELSSVFVIAAPHAHAASAELPATLPATATTLPLLGLIGLLSLLVALILRQAAARTT